MIDDDVRHHVAMPRDGLDVRPIADLGIDHRVIDRIKSSVCSVDRQEERQDMNASENALEGADQEIVQIR